MQPLALYTVRESSLWHAIIPIHLARLPQISCRKKKKKSKRPYLPLAQAAVWSWQDSQGVILGRGPAHLPGANHRQAYRGASATGLGGVSSGSNLRSYWWTCDDVGDCFDQWLRSRSAGQTEVVPARRPRSAGAEWCRRAGSWLLRLGFPAKMPRFALTVIRQ